MKENRSQFAEQSKQMFTAASIFYVAGIVTGLIKNGMVSFVASIAMLVGFIMMLVNFRKYSRISTDRKINTAFWLYIAGIVTAVLAFITLIGTVLSIFASSQYGSGATSNQLAQLFLTNIGAFGFGLVLLLAVYCMSLAATIFVILFFKNEMAGTDIEKKSTIMLWVIVGNAIITVFGLFDTSGISGLLSLVINGLWIYYYYLIKQESEKIALESYVVEDVVDIYEEKAARKAAKEAKAEVTEVEEAQAEVEETVEDVPAVEEIVEETTEDTEENE